MICAARAFTLNTLSVFRADCHHIHSLCPGYYCKTRHGVAAAGAGQTLLLLPLPPFPCRKYRLSWWACSSYKIARSPIMGCKYRLVICANRENTCAYAFGCSDCPAAASHIAFFPCRIPYFIGKMHLRVRVLMISLHMYEYTLGYGNSCNYLCASCAARSAT